MSESVSCAHTDQDRCDCPCHGPKIVLVHVFPCCKVCARCRRRVKIPPPER